jgi:hypothetical protein
LRACIHINAKEFRHIAKGLAEHEVGAPRDHRHGLCPQTLKQGHPVGIRLHIDGLMINVVGRKKLFRSQATCSPRLPENADDFTLRHLIFSLKYYPRRDHRSLVWPAHDP